MSDTPAIPSHRATLKALLHTNDRFMNILATAWIQSVRDFLQYLPRTYQDRSNLTLLRDLDTESNDVQSVIGQIIAKKQLPRWAKKLYEIEFHDVVGDVGYITFFNTYFPTKALIVGNRYIITGKVKYDYKKLIFSHPQSTPTDSPDDWLIDAMKEKIHQTPIENNEKIGIFDDETKPSPWLTSRDDRKHTNDMLSSLTPEVAQVGRIYPIYPELQGIKADRWAKNMRKLLPLIPDHFAEYLPLDFLQKFSLMGVQEMIHTLHFPASMEVVHHAQHRLFFDRLLRIQLHSLIKKQAYLSQWSTKSPTPQQVTGQAHQLTNSPASDYSLISSLTTLLPFTLTTAQKRVVKELIDDMHLDKPMMRLLQGDVGSGKTVVAAIAAYYTIKKRWGQAVFLAPLSILAQQHHRSLAKLLLPLGLRVELLSGSRTASEKADIKRKLADGQIDVIVGTHALLQEDVHFHNLTLAVVDEQHKFGVRQRGFFSQHGHPHIIQMSATPIPRSMALAFFGEFDVSIIDELPAGRKPITTKVITRSDWLKLKPWILDKISLGQKVFFVAPLIEESDKLEEVHNVTALYEEVCAMFTQTQARIGLMHGKMKSRDKDEVMQQFKTGKINILVSTTVIEVGVDIPEATIMVIKNSERFGLAQLHQLRGRIGRSDLQSYCFLETKTRSWDSYQRIKVLEETNDGFKLAQIDLQHRGTGEILGTRQSGESDIPIEILGDLKFIEQVRQGAERLLEQHPHLDGLPGLQKYLHEKLGGILH